MKTYSWVGGYLMTIMVTGTIFPSEHADFATQTNLSSKNASTQTYSIEATNKLWKALDEKNEGEALASLDEGADINASRFSYTVLQCVIDKGFESVFQRLLQNGARINALARYGGQSALSEAVNANQHRMMEELVRKYGADVNQIVDEDGNTILLNSLSPLPTSTNKTSMKLIELGANVNAANKYGETPLHKVAYYGNKEIFDFLLKHGASTDAIEKDGHTVLMSAALGRNIHIISTLLRCGCDVNAKKRYGVTALWFAVSFSPYGGPHSAVIKTLLTAGADIDVYPEHYPEESIVSFAESNCDLECQKMLQQKLAECLSKQRSS